MSVKENNTWSLVKFATTLNYFGEVPFLGSFRWLQQWLGQNPMVAGKVLNAMQKKVVMTGQLPEAAFGSLQARVSPIIDLSVYDGNNAQNSGASSYSELVAVAAKVDTIVVWNHVDALALVAALSTCAGGTMGAVRQRVFDFTQANSDISAWGSLDDVVMGGVSEGAFFLGPQDSADVDTVSITPSITETSATENYCAIFSGCVSTQNSGGFSSVRTRNFEPPFNLAGWTGLRLRVKGDGQRYKFIVRNSQAWDSPAYVYIFDTVANGWIDVEVPFAELVPTFRAKSVPNASPFDPSQTVSFQLMLSKFEYDGRLNSCFSAGAFKLSVAKVEAYRGRQGVPLVVVGAKETAERDRQQSALAESGLRYRFIEPEGQDLIEAIAAALS
ncbi:MAG: CIA30 family protein [Cyanobacteria bacterium J06629_19]